LNLRSSPAVVSIGTSYFLKWGIAPAGFGFSIVGIAVKLREGYMRVLLLLLAMAVALCSSQCQKSTAGQAAAPQDPPTKPAPATPIDAKKAELGGKTWDPEWDVIVEKSIPPEMLSSQVPRDVKRFCPRFYDMNETDKRAFWAYFFQALAGAEAGLDPKTRAHHTQPEVNVRDGVSGMSGRTEGLLQLTYEDEKRYGCDFDWQSDRKLPAKDPNRTILQPKNNLQCGVKILANQIIVQHRPLLYHAGYWSTLQPGRPSYRVFAKEMTNPPAACAAPVKSAVVKPNQTTQTVQQAASEARTAHK
jgi:hypothetical protein